MSGWSVLPPVGKEGYVTRHLSFGVHLRQKNILSWGDQEDIGLGTDLLGSGEGPRLEEGRR